MAKRTKSAAVKTAIKNQAVKTTVKPGKVKKSKTR
jgi:hypothetical protein